jgi:hypothetical protein
MRGKATILVLLALLSRGSLISILNHQGLAGGFL